MKNVRIAFRLSPYQLARGLQIIRQLEPNYQLINLNDIVKIIYHDYLAKMSINKLDSIPEEILAEIASFIDKPPRENITLEEFIDIQEPKPKPKLKSEPKSELSDEILKEINRTPKQSKASSFDDPNETDSEISSLTDFSPPKDWMND